MSGSIRTLSVVLFLLVGPPLVHAQQRADAPAEPATVRQGRPVEVTVTVPDNAKLKVPQDARQLIATVGMSSARVTRVSGNQVTVLVPAFAGGSGERHIAIFDASGTQLARGTIAYEQPPNDLFTGFRLNLLFLLLALPILMLWYDIRKAYAFASETRTAIIANASRNGLTLKELQLLLGHLGQAPPGIPGLARTMMAFMLLVIVTISLFYVLTSGISDVPDVVDKTITVLATAVTTVVAFYFGARTATSAADAAAQSTQLAQSGGGGTTQTTTTVNQPQTPGRTFIKFMPVKAPVGSDVTLSGGKFGTPAGEVRFGSIKATTVGHWSDGIVRAQVPSGLTKGQKVVIEVVPAGSTQAQSTAPAEFEVA